MVQFILRLYLPESTAELPGAALQASVGRSGESESSHGIRFKLFPPKLKVIILSYDMNPPLVLSLCDMKRPKVRHVSHNAESSVELKQAEQGFTGTSYFRLLLS